MQILQSVAQILQNYYEEQTKKERMKKTMSETRYSLLRDEVSRKVIAWLLIMAMMLGLVPSNFSIVAKAAENLNITAHLKVSGWERPAVQAWNGTFTLTGDGEEELVPGWDGAKATPMKDEGDGWLQNSCRDWWYADSRRSSYGTRSHDDVGAELFWEIENVKK